MNVYSIYKLDSVSYMTYYMTNVLQSMSCIRGGSLNQILNYVPQRSLFLGARTRATTKETWICICRQIVVGTYFPYIRVRLVRDILENLILYYSNAINQRCHSSADKICHVSLATGKFFAYLCHAFLPSQTEELHFHPIRSGAPV